MWNKKITAFTLYEMLIAMTITALILPLIWSGWSLVQRQYQLFETTQDQILEAKTFQQFLLRDLEEFQHWYIRSNELIFSSIGEDRVKYQFLDSLTIRKREWLDSFHFTTIIEDIKLVDSQQELIEAGQLSIQLFTQSNKVLLRKSYSASDLIKYIDNGY